MRLRYSRPDSAKCGSSMNSVVGGAITRWGICDDSDAIGNLLLSCPAVTCIINLRQKPVGDFRSRNNIKIHVLKFDFPKVIPK